MDVFTESNDRFNKKKRFFNFINASIGHLTHRDCKNYSISFDCPVDIEYYKKEDLYDHIEKTLASEITRNITRFLIVTIEEKEFILMKVTDDTCIKQCTKIHVHISYQPFPHFHRQMIKEYYNASFAKLSDEKQSTFKNWKTFDFTLDADRYIKEVAKDIETHSRLDIRNLIGELLPHTIEFRQQKYKLHIIFYDKENNEVKYTPMYVRHEMTMLPYYKRERDDPPIPMIAFFYLKSV